MGPVVFGDRLRQARILRQKRLVDVADLLDFSVPTVSKWERARLIDISESQLSTIANSLRFSPDFFSTHPSPPLYDNDLLFKAPKSTPKREIDWLREFVRLISELLDWLDERQPLPPVKLKLRSSAPGDVREGARELRDRLNLAQTEPIKYLTHPAERAGVIVAVRRGGNVGSGSGGFDISRAEGMTREHHEGCSSWIGEFRERPLIVMRGVATWEKTRWVLSHELGHLYLHAGRTLVSEESEEAANAFASELLAPIEQISKELPPVVTLTGLLELKVKWGISLATLIRHLHSNGAITDQRKKTLYDQLYTRKNPETGRSFGATEPGWDKREPERPRLISAWLERIMGSTKPEAVASTSKIFPPDLLGSILSEQRGAPARHRPNRAAAPSTDDSRRVVYLHDRFAENSPEKNQESAQSLPASHYL